MKLTPINLTAPVQIRAAAKRGPRRFTTRAYNGGPLKISGYDLPVVIDLGGLTSRNGVQANLDHDEAKRVGQVDAIGNDGESLTLGGIVSAASESAREFLESADRGYQWQASVEVSPTTIREVAEGQVAHVNGREQAGPFYLTTSGVLHGVAFLAAGADDSTSVTIAATHKGKTMSFQNWMTEIGLTTDTMTEGQLAAIHANYNGRENANDADRAAVAPMIAAAASDPVAAENRRVAQIEAATRGEWGDHAAEMSQIRAAAMGGDITIDQLLERTRAVRLKMLESTMGAARAPSATSAARVDAGRMMEAALCQTVGLPDLDKKFNDQILQAAHDRYHGRVGLQQLLLAAAAENGMDVRPGDRISNGNLRQVLAAALPPIHAGGFSTLSLPGVLSNTANKSLMAGWEEGDQTWRQIAAVKPVSDFKQAISYRLLDSIMYEKVSPGGEIKHTTVDEESYSRQAHTYGIMFSLTRTDIVNDDLGAFEDMRTRVGRGALAKFNDIFWARFLNNGSFFTSGNGNAVTVAPLGVDGAGLEKVVLAFRRMVSVDGKSVDGEPTILLAPPELEFAARRLYQSTNLTSTGDTDAQFAAANIHGGLYKPLIQNRLSNAGYTGYSTDAWYLLRPPAVAAVVAVSFLDGKQTPTVDTAEAEFNTLGIQMRGYHDFGVDLTVDYLAGVRSDGA